MTKRSECGCKVDYDVSWSSAEPQRGNLRIAYCPLHLAAPRLLDALERALTRLENMEDYDLSKDIEAILREARGSK